MIAKKAALGKFWAKPGVSRFYEGKPTLSQYGLTLLSLLML